MARIEVKNNQLVIHMQGIRKFATLKSELSVSLHNVKSVAINKEAWDGSPRLGQKRFGTEAYGLYFGGTFRQKGNKVFYDLKRNESAIDIELRESDHGFSRLIIGVDNAEEVVKLIEGSL